MLSDDVLVYIDLDDTIFDYSGAKARAINENPKQVYPQSEYGFFMNLEPLPMAIEVTKKLLKNYRTFFLTAPSVKNPLSYTEKRVCIYNHFGIEGASRLIICPDKSLLKGEFLIDDITHGKGQEGFEGTLIHFGSDEFKDWSVIEKYFNLN